jgi:tRNA(fMet)-specific endonuclease VapC
VKFLLGTDTCIYAIKQDASVLRRLLSESRADIAVSVITEGELRTARPRARTPTRRVGRVENFLRPLSILEFTSEDAASYAQIRARRERAGTPIGPLDTLIAAQAVLRKRTLVTNNQREFSRIPGLRVENWSAD